jgi:hypothetical protein
MPRPREGLALVSFDWPVYEDDEDEDDGDGGGGNGGAGVEAIDDGLEDWQRRYIYHALSIA